VHRYLACFFGEWCLGNFCLDEKSVECRLNFFALLWTTQKSCCICPVAKIITNAFHFMLRNFFFLREVYELIYYYYFKVGLLAMFLLVDEFLCLNWIFKILKYYKRQHSMIKNTYAFTLATFCKENILQKGKTICLLIKTNRITRLDRWSMNNILHYNRINFTQSILQGCQIQKFL